MRRPALCCVLLALAACRQPREADGLRVACAANLSSILSVLARASGENVQPAYGSTATLTEQIENGAPYDIFLAADRKHVEHLAELHETSRVFAYARGRLALYTRKRSGMPSAAELSSPSMHFLAIANPELAPYGRAAVEALRAMNIWEAVQHRVVYTPDIGAVRALVDSGNADAGFTALSLVPPEARYPVDPKLYHPIEQWGCVLASSKQPEAAEHFVAFLLSAKGRKILQGAGYAAPD
ncbi:MAG TPA: molybdate ABC transporter substrate-binding protein [Solibacterales bacterium]|nr:molybdate ABC transporter substrate-binding protein [Bryobacterales bacterium]